MAHVLETKLKLDTTDFVRKSKQATTEAKKVGAAGDKAGTTTAQGMNKASAGMSNFARSAESAAGAVIARFIGVGAVVAGVQRAISAAIADSERLAKQRQEFFPQLRSAIMGRGDSGSATAIKNIITQELPKAGLGRDAALGLYEGIGGSLSKPTDSPEAIMALMRAGAPGAIGGIDAKQLGMTMGELSKTFPGMSPSEIAGRASAIAQGTGTGFRRLQRRGLSSMREMIGAGIGGDEAQTLLMASLYTNRTTEASELLSDQVGLQKTGKEIRGLKQANMKRFYRASGEDRLKMLKSDPSLVRDVFGTQAQPVLNMLQAAPGFTGKLSTDPSAQRRALNQDADLARTEALDIAEAGAVASEMVSPQADRVERIDYVAKKMRQRYGGGIRSRLFDWNASIFPYAKWAVGPGAPLLRDPLSIGEQEFGSITVHNSPGVQFNMTPGRTADTTTTRPAGGGSSGGAGGDGGW